MAKLGDTVKGARVLSARIRAAEAADPEGRMSLIEHIRELRNRVVKIAWRCSSAPAWGCVFFEPVWHLIERPFCAAKINGHTGCYGIGHQLVLNSVLAPFMLRVEVAFFFGLVVTSPIWLYQIWAFVAPGLYRREKRWTYAFVGAAVPLFLIGAGIAYFAMSRGLALPARPDPGRGPQPAPGLHLPRLLLRHGARLRAGLRAAAAGADAQRGRRAHPRVLPQVAAAHHLRRVRVRRHRLAQPRPADHAPAGRALRGAGRGRPSSSSG